VSDLEYAVKDGIATARLNRPAKKNALSEEMVGGLARALREAQDDLAVRVFIVTGAGDAFCSGGDLGRRARKGKARRPRPCNARPGSSRARTASRSPSRNSTSRSSLR